MTEHDGFVIGDMDSLVGALPGMLGHVPAEDICMVVWSEPDSETMLSTSGAACRINLADVDYDTIVQAVQTLALHGKYMMLVIVTDHPQEMGPWVDFIEDNPLMHVIGSRVVPNMVAPSAEVMEFLMEKGKPLPASDWSALSSPFEPVADLLTTQGTTGRLAEALSALVDGGGTDQDMADVAASMDTWEDRGVLAYTVTEDNAVSVAEALRRVAVHVNTANAYAACGMAYWAGFRAAEAQVALFKALELEPGNVLANTIIGALRLGLEPTAWFEAREQEEEEG